MSETNADTGLILATRAKSSSDWGVATLSVRKGQNIYVRGDGNTHGVAKVITYQ